MMSLANCSTSPLTQDVCTPSGDSLSFYKYCFILRAHLVHAAHLMMAFLLVMSKWLPYLWSAWFQTASNAQRTKPK